LALTITHPNAAGIDIGSASHFVAVPPDRDDEPVREFPSFTADLQRHWPTGSGLRRGHGGHGVHRRVLDPSVRAAGSRGFTVLLVNARHVKNVSGRKSDVLDCQWLQQLMTYGLLRGAFRPPSRCACCARCGASAPCCCASQGRSVQHMQKALTQMNIQLANVISDVVGESGQKILRAIVAGERDGQVLGKMKNCASAPASMRSPRACKATGAPSTCSRSSRRWTRSTSRHATGRVRRRRSSAVAAAALTMGEPGQRQEARSARNAPEVRSAHAAVQDVRRGPHAHRRHRRDHRAGGDQRDRHRHVALSQRRALRSWLGLCPGTKITGGKVMSGKTKRCANRAAQALRWRPRRCAPASRRWARTSGGCAPAWTSPKAVTAAAHKLARLIYTMLTKGQEYTDQGQDYYEERYRQRVLHNWPSAPRRWA
jgi:transposase